MARLQLRLIQSDDSPKETELPESITKCESGFRDLPDGMDGRGRIIDDVPACRCRADAAGSRGGSCCWPNGGGPA